ncbi:hypothetical protein [Endozoicomonas sp. 4G]|uniref:hypothetical protein n=1 Tax=Endozoicomonas sp. 4G TaxID=2872754 RepID=UPI002078543B|nr:hypothetical protein [Endozoicomonas sp. 4G]
MFKKKSLLSEFPHPSGSCLFLSASLIFSLSSGTAYSIPPVKNSAGSIVFSGEAPELPGTEELGATGITTSDVTENATMTALDTPFAASGVTWSVTIPWEPASQSTEPPSAPNGASNAALSGQHPMLPVCSDLPDEDVESDWQAHFEMLLSELDSDPADGTNDSFPALDLVNPSLQQIELSNDSLNGALLTIEAGLENYTVIDLYYVLWSIAKLNGQQSLMKVLRLNATILKHYLNLREKSFYRELRDKPFLLKLLSKPLSLKLPAYSIRKLVHSGELARLRSSLSQANPGREIGEIMTQFIFNDLYSYIHSEATSELEQDLAFCWPSVPHTLKFLYELAQISSQLFDGNNYVVPNNIAYARSRAFYFIFSHFGHKPFPQAVFDSVTYQHRDPRILEEIKRSAQRDRDLYYAYRSLTALFTLFLGDLDMAENMLERIGRQVPAFGLRHAPDVDSLVRWAVDGNLRMFEPPERDRIIRALSLMVSHPFPQSPIHRVPDTVLSAVNPEVLKALEKELSRFKSE